MTDSVSSGVGVFLAVYAVALAAWVSALLLHRRARKHYHGPKGWARLLNPFAQYRAKHYAAPGISLLRLEVACIAVFVVACLVGLFMARLKVLGHM